MFPKGKLNCISFYLTRVKLEFSIAIIHERGSNSFSKLGYFSTNFG
jgi:hypothetical protein